MLQNAYLVAKIGGDTAENERNFAEICQKLATTLRVQRLAARRADDGPLLLLLVFGPLGGLLRLFLGLVSK